jgi:hypothetical protein
VVVDEGSHIQILPIAIPRSKKCKVCYVLIFCADDLGGHDQIFRILAKLFIKCACVCLLHNYILSW